jgi:hypothetical protein
MDFDHRGPVGWQRTNRSTLARTLGVSHEAYGLERTAAEKLAHDLESGGWTVRTDYYIPAYKDLLRDYSRLGAAYLNNLINVRWVMCRETHDALAKRYSQARFSAMPRLSAVIASSDSSIGMFTDTVHAVMENRLHWGGDQSKLFGVPIRLDPVARRPVFEIVPADEEERRA